VRQRQLYLRGATHARKEIRGTYSRVRRRARAHIHTHTHTHTHPHTHTHTHTHPHTHTPPPLLLLLLSPPPTERVHSHPVAWVVLHPQSRKRRHKNHHHRRRRCCCCLVPPRPLVHEQTALQVQAPLDGAAAQGSTTAAQRLCLALLRRCLQSSPARLRQRARLPPQGLPHQPHRRRGCWWAVLQTQVPLCHQAQSRQHADVVHRLVVPVKRPVDKRARVLSISARLVLRYRHRPWLLTARKRTAALTTAHNTGSGWHDPPWCACVRAGWLAGWLAGWRAWVRGRVRVCVGGWVRECGGGVAHLRQHLIHPLLYVVEPAQRPRQHGWLPSKRHRKATPRRSLQ
jgi:hypothetical protein